MKFELPHIKEGMRHMNDSLHKRFSNDDEEKDFYKNFLVHQFILRDHLAIDRTMLANESTFLAYIRTGLAVSAAGATVIHFAVTEFSDFVGGGLLFAGITIFFFGISRYNKMKKKISHIQDSTNLSDEYTRNRIRHHILPILEQQVNGKAASHMAETAARNSQAEEYLTQQSCRGLDGFQKVKE